MEHAARREGQPPGRQPIRSVLGTMVGRPVLNATAFIAVPSVMFGAIEVLVPLRIDALRLHWFEAGHHEAGRRRQEDEVTRLQGEGPFTFDGESAASS